MLGSLYHWTLNCTLEYDTTQHGYSKKEPQFNSRRAEVIGTLVLRQVTQSSRTFFSKLYNYITD
jgi:hypothetical protein